MRTSACILIVLLVTLAVACKTAATPEPLRNTAAVPVDVEITLDAPMRERLALGLPINLELRVTSPDVAVGTCSLGYDLWEENYRVALSKTTIARAGEPTEALRMCLDMRKLYDARRAAEVSHTRFSRKVTVREVELIAPLYDTASDVRVY